jgi:Fur family ferric uptake transcriptional regulator
MQHDHLIDIESGKVIEFCDPRIDEIIRTACGLNNFKASHHSLYIYGTSRDSEISD